MEFSAKKDVLKKQYSDCIIVGVFEPCYLFLTSRQIDEMSKGYITTLLSKGELEGKIDQTLILYNVPNIPSERILLIGCGKKYELNERNYKRIIKNAISTLNNTGSIEAICFLTELNVKGLNIYWKVRQAIEAIEETLYNFKYTKNKEINSSARLLQKVVFNITTSQELISSNQAIIHGIAIANGIKTAKDLSNMPPNICNSTYLSLKAHQLAEDHGNEITVKIVNEQQMKELGMNAYLAVGQGSANESLMSIINYNGNPESGMSPIILIGKGLTFDTGGISIKPADNMNEMKYDMCGAAAVYGVMCVAIALKLPLNIIGILACCENMINDRAFRPGDILTTLSGLTVEVLNTDAEGRLILCDVLSYVERFKPDVVIDIATLTGACVIALGNHLTGLISNSDLLINELINASKQACDRIWHLPLDYEFQEQLKSNFADIANIGGRSGGVITAGCFLSRFTNKYNWAHLDIAGTAWRTGQTKGATGRPVAMLSQFLLNRSKINIDD